MSQAPPPGDPANTVAVGDLLSLYDTGAKENAYNILPPDVEYTFEIVSARYYDDSGSIALQYKVVAGPLTGTKFKAGWLNTRGKDGDNTKALSMFQRNIASMGIDRETAAQLQTLPALADALVGRVLKATITTYTNGGNEYNQVAIGGYELVSTPPLPGQAGVPQAAQTQIEQPAQTQPVEQVVQQPVVQQPVQTQVVQQPPAPSPNGQPVVQAQPTVPSHVQVIPADQDAPF